jgi:hypothetical protein
VRARYRAGKASWWRVYGVAEDAAMPVNRQNAGRFCRAKACVEENSQMLADGARARLSALNDLTTFVHALFRVWSVAESIAAVRIIHDFIERRRLQGDI